MSLFLQFVMSHRKYQSWDRHARILQANLTWLLVYCWLMVKILNFTFCYTFADNDIDSPTHDFVFLMDSSSDVSAPDFYQQIVFVKSLARTLNTDVSPSEFQAAAIAYGENYYPVVLFDSYNSKPEFYSAVDSSRYQGGARRMDRALEAASKMMSSREPTSKKTVVVLTGGRNSQEAGFGAIARSVQRLKQMGANIIIVAFGKKYDVQELLPAVQQEQDIRSVPRASDLVSYINLIASYIKSGPESKEYKIVQ